MLDPDQALRVVLESIERLAAERVPLADAVERVLAEDVVARRDHPPADNSAMDGWALIDADTEGATESEPCHLTTVGRSFAGAPFAGQVVPASAVRITTGAHVPRGATAVVPQERVIDHGETIELRAAVRPGANIRRAGEEYRAGETLLGAGLPLNPPAIGLIASAGVAHVSVVRVPRVAVFVTGDELIDVERAAERPDLLVDSNGPLLRAALLGEGAVVVRMARLGDDADGLALALRGAAEVADVILTTGAASVGPADIVERAWAAAGIRTLFWKVAMRPGKPVRFGLLASATNGSAPIPCFALPGNPLAVVSGFERFVRPALDRLRGREPSPPVRVRVPLELGCDVGDRAWFARGRIVGDGAAARFRFDPKQGSGMLKQAASGGGVAVLAPRQVPLAAGDEVDVETDAHGLRGRSVRIVDVG